MAALTTTTHAQLGEEHGLAGGWDEKGPWRVRPLLVEWFEKDLLMRELAGGTAYSGPFGSGTWTRVLPYQDPEDPTLYVSNLTWQPEGKLLTTFPVISYSHAIVMATFRRPEFAFQASDDPIGAAGIDPSTPLPYCTQALSFGAEYYDIPNSSVTFPGGLKFDKPVSRRVQTIDILLTFHQWPYIPTQLFAGFADCINSTTFLGFAPELVMFLGAETDPTGNEDGTFTQEIPMRFKARTISWNKFLRPDNLTFDYLTDNTSAKIYTLKDLRPLLLTL